MTNHSLTIVAMLAATGCYTELGIGFTGAIGPRVDNKGVGGYVTIGTGFQFDDGGPTRVAVGTSTHVAQVDFDRGFAAPFGFGVGVGYDRRVMQLAPNKQLRISTWATLWDVSTSMDAPGQDRPATNIHVHDGFVGLTLGVFCDHVHGCGQISIGAPLTFIYSNETRWALVTGGEIRVSVGQTLWERLDKNTSALPRGSLSE